MTVIHEIAEAVRHQEEPCPNCNGNRHYTLGERTIFCAVCCPDLAEGQELLADCTSKHRNASVRHWAGQRQAGWVVTLVGGPCRSPVSHQFFVRASSRKGAIETAKNNNHYVPTANLRCTRVRLMCPCDAGGWQ